MTSTVALHAPRPMTNLMNKGVKIAIKPFVFLTEPSGVGCKGLIVRFAKNAVQPYIFRKTISKNKRSSYKNIQRKWQRHLRPGGSGNTSYFGLPDCPPNISAFSEPPRNFRDFEYLLGKNGPETQKGKRLSTLLLNLGSGTAARRARTILVRAYSRLY